MRRARGSAFAPVLLAAAVAVAGAGGLWQRGGPETPAAPPPLDPAVRDAMVAALPKHSIPLAVDVTDGHTFSGFTRSNQNGTISDSPTPPQFVSGHRTSHFLSWNIVGQERFNFCDPNQPFSIFSSVVVNEIVLHFTVDATDTPGDVTAVNVVIPAFTTLPPGATTDFPINLLNVLVEVSTESGEGVSGELSPAPPPLGAAAAFLLTLDTPLSGVDGVLHVDVVLSGQVEPALVVVDSGLSNCPPGVPQTPFTNFEGLSILTVENTFVVVFIEPAVPDGLVVAPTAATLEVGQSQSFAAFNCPPDANGDPDPGQNGVPGNEDDLCEQNESAVWNVSGPIGSLDTATGSSSILTASLPAGSAAQTGQVVASTDGGLTASATVTVIAPPPPGAVTITPPDATLNAGSSQGFAAFDCPPDANGNPDAGQNGVPGNEDDLCMPNENAVWTTEGGIGDVSPTGGASVTLTAVNLSPGDTRTGSVTAATPGSGTATATVTVVGLPRDPPTHAIKIEVEHMFRQGLSLAENATAGADQIVVAPMTAHELTESLDEMAPGKTVLPFDALASLRGELVSCERTILAVHPPDLGTLREEILDEIAASGADPTDARAIARFLRRHPDRARIVLTLDAGIERDLLVSEGAWVGSVDAGFLQFRPDLLLREAQRERNVRTASGERRIRVVVNLVEDDEVTNVLPYRDRLGWLEAWRLARSPAEGGIFQNAGTPGVAQLLVAADGPFSPGLTDFRSFAHVHAGDVGESGARAAHGLAHMIGHLLFGPRHDASSLFSLMHPLPPDDDAFYEQAFGQFEYSDRTVRRGIRQLDRRWRSE